MPGKENSFQKKFILAIATNGFIILFTVTVTRITSFCGLKFGFFTTVKKGDVFQGERGSTACDSGLQEFAY